MMRSFHIGVDVGGTFTDLVCVDETGHMAATKVPNVGDDPSSDVIAGLDDLAVGLDLEAKEFFGSIEVIVHGSTVATNAVLTGRGAVTGLLTTEGFRDALEMRRGLRERLYDNKYTPPPPLVPRHLRLGVTERFDAEGVEIEPLDHASLASAIATLRDHNVESVAVCYMHAYRSYDHEEETGRYLAEAWPEAHVSLSHEVLPERKFYERLSTTAINAYVGTIIDRYLDNLTAQLESRGFRGALRIMKSNGGMMSPEMASSREAAYTLLSGPAGAVAGGTYFSSLHGEPNLLVIDMGGTSFDVCLIEEGTALVTRDGSVARYRLMLPMLDIHTVGAGGGSIASVDNAGLLEVGPASAGSHPGPACYGRGGEYATVTDADVMLGYIDPAYFLGGRMRINGELADQAVRLAVGEPLDMSVAEAAAGIYDVVNAKMGAAIREVSVQRGYDPRTFMLLVAGGAGAVHVCPIAYDIGIRRVIVPRDASVFSAFGMLTTEFRHDFVRTYTSRLLTADRDELRVAFAAMSVEGEEILESEGVAPGDINHLLKMDLRYEGQIHEVELPIEEVDLNDKDLPEVHRKFHKRHADMYSYSTDEDPVEIVNLRLSSVGKAWNVEVHRGEPTTRDASVALKGRRPAYLSSSRTLVEMSVYDGSAIEPGMRLTGPVIVELPDTNIVVDDHFDLECDVFGNFVLNARAT